MGQSLFWTTPRDACSVLRPTKEQVMPVLSLTLKEPSLKTTLLPRCSSLESQHRDYLHGSGPHWLFKARLPRTALI